MLARKRNMFISFRYAPRRSQDSANQIKTNVRERLRKLSDDKENENVAAIRSRLNDMSIENMTSLEISDDIRSHYRTHEPQMRNIIFTKKCWKAICCNANLFKDKIVLDVSCGLGILSMFSAIAGSKHVYAIDTSNVVELTRRIITDNKLTHKITVIQGKAAEISLPVDKVDIIVSSFFGDELFVGNRLDELIDARNKWLSADGLMFPDQCNYYIAAINNKMLRDRSNYWEHVCTFGMRPMIQAARLEPYFQYVDFDQLVTNVCPIKHLNMYTVEKSDYRRFDAPFCLESGINAYIGAFITYFDVTFGEGVKPIKFTTQPGWRTTHWKPLVFFLSQNDFHIDSDETFYGVFRMNALSSCYRKIDWNIEVMHRGEHCGFRQKWNFELR